MTPFDRYEQRVGTGETLSAEEIRALAISADVLSLGMLADSLRRRLHGTRTTFLRVQEVPCDQVAEGGVLASAGEVRLTGSPQDLASAVKAVRLARAAAGACPVAAFSWADVERWSAGGQVGPVLEQLRAAGLEAFVALPLDELANAARAVESLARAGFGRLRLTVNTAPADERTNLLLRARELQDAFGCVQAINPLPMTLLGFRPTTGYEDVRMVAIARLAAPAVPSIQVDWKRYGPKLAQVALSFGADDVDGVSASDEAPEGRRRAPLAEIRRNIEAAGLVAAERDGRFAVLG